MKILIGSNVHWWNAEAAYAAVTAELLQQAGHQVYVLTRPGTLNECHLTKRKLTVITDIDMNSNNPFRLFLSYRKLKRFLQEYQIEIVNPHRSEGYIIYVLLAWSLKSFKLVRTRGTTRPVRNSWINRKIYCQWTDAHIMAGKVVQERFTRLMPIAPEQLNLIYYPIDTPTLPILPHPPYLQEFQLPHHARTLGIVGRISPVKGHSLLLESFKHLRQQFDDLYLLVIYKDPDPKAPELLALQEDVHREHLTDYVRFIGPREDIRALMEFVDVGVVSSTDSEVICRVAVEFFSVATPVVAFPTGCLPEIIQHGTNGYLASAQNASALAEALTLIFKNDQQRKQLGRAARKDAEARFAQQRFLQATLEVFNSVLRS
ncbi:glycosyltransferase family 4 protein [Deltaproteobacteria bacterium TL4]